MATPTSKRTTAPAFQFYPKDFLSSSKVQRMTLTEIGVYALLLSHAWLDGGLPLDVAEIAKLVKVQTPRFRRMWQGPLSECFVERAGRYVNMRLEHERKAQAEFRKRQAENGKLGGRPKKAVGSSGLTQTEAKESSPISSLQSSSPVRTHRQGGAPIHGNHSKHAACGVVCLPGDLHERFVRALRRDDADQVLRKWYGEVLDEWTDGAKKDVQLTGNDYQFWRARYAERWPTADDAASVPAKRDTRPQWIQDAEARKRARGGPVNAA